MTIQTDRRVLWLLTAGGLVGILAGIFSALSDRISSDIRVLPTDAVALVNGRPISEEEYASAVALLAGDKRTEITDEDRAHVLDRLIEEELLVQHGVARGVIDADRSIRKTITQAMLASITAESASELPSEDVLRTFYEQNLLLFTDATSEGEGTETHTARAPVFESARERVEEVYLQRARDDALREYLQWLRAEAKVVVAPEMR